MCVVAPAKSLIVSCGLSNGLNVLYKSRGSFLCGCRNRDWILMIAHAMMFTPGNGDLVQPGYHTSVINHAVYSKDSSYRLWAAVSMRSVFLHNILHFRGTTVYQILKSDFSLWRRPGLHWYDVRLYFISTKVLLKYINWNLFISKSDLLYGLHFSTIFFSLHSTMLCKSVIKTTYQKDHTSLFLTFHH